MQRGRRHVASRTEAASALNAEDPVLEPRDDDGIGGAGMHGKCMEKPT